jgi:SAM-dependent methyltransferase
MSALAAYESGLRGEARCYIRSRSGAAVPVLPERWLRSADVTDDVLLEPCIGPALDVGCGPGRLTEELGRRGVPGLGIDISGEAVRLARTRGAAALQRDVFGPVPGEGRWSTVLLADGNVGIGGDPIRLLQRARALLARRGRVIVEVEPAGVGLQRLLLRLESEPSVGGWFRWARVDVAVIADVAAVAGLRLTALAERAGRLVAELEAT